MKSNPVINKRAHVRGQLPNSASPTGTSKLAKRENERDPPPDTPVRIVIPGKPNNVLFDFRTLLAVRFFDDGGVMVGVDVGGVGKPRWMVPAGLSLSG